MEKNKKMTKKTTIKLFGVDVDFGADPGLVKWLFVLVLEVTLLGLTGFVFLRPSWQDFGVMRSNLKKERETVLGLAAKVELLETFQLQNAKKYQYVLEDVILPDKDVGLVLSSLVNLAKSIGVEVTDYSLKPGEIYTQVSEPQVKSNNEIEIELSVTGSSTLVTSFLQLVDTSLPLKQIKNLGIKSIEGSEGQISELALELVAYYLPFEREFNQAEILRPFTSTHLSLAEELGLYARFEVPTIIEVPKGKENLFGL